MDNFLSGVSEADLLALKETYKANLSMVASIDTALEIRLTEALKAEADAKFLESIKGFTNLPTPPEGTINILLRWVKTEAIEASDAIPAGKAVKNAEGEIVTPATDTQPAIEASPESWGWIVTTNHKCNVTVTGKSTASAAKKRAIIVKKIEGSSVILIGEYDTGADFCKAYNLEVAGSSAIKVIKAAGYLVYDKETSNPK